MKIDNIGGIDVSKSATIFQGSPRDKEIKNDLPEVELSDFEEVKKEDFEFIEEPEEEKKEGPEEVQELEAEEVDPDEKRKKEVGKKSTEMRKRVVQLIDAEIIISIVDMALSRGGTFALQKSNKNDWKLDQEEKEILSTILEALIEEEEIQFWSAKTWLIIAVVLIYALKSYDVYEVYYSDAGIEERTPEIRLEEARKEVKKEETELAILEMKAELIEKKARLKDKIRKAQNSIDEDISLEEVSLRDKKRKDEKEKDLYSPEDYPHEIYVWNNGKLQFNQDGTPRKKPGKKKNSTDKLKTKIHPQTKKFCKDVVFFDYLYENPDLWHKYPDQTLHDEYRAYLKEEEKDDKVFKQLYPVDEILDLTEQQTEEV